MENKEFSSYEKLSLATDTIILTSDVMAQSDKRLTAKRGIQVLLVKRTDAHLKGQWALPGGFVDSGKGVLESAQEKLLEKTGLKEVYMEQLKTYGDNVIRDSRGRVVSVAYIVLADKQSLTSKQVQHDETETKWFWVCATRDKHNNVTDLKFVSEDGYMCVETLAFDHKEMVIDSLNRIKNKCEYTDVIFNMMPSAFTIRELQDVYEWAVGYPIASFRRKIQSKVTETEAMMCGNAHRPASYFKYNKPIQTL